MVGKLKSGDGGLEDYILSVNSIKQGQRIAFEYTTDANETIKGYGIVVGYTSENSLIRNFIIQPDDDFKFPKHMNYDYTHFVLHPSMMYLLYDDERMTQKQLLDNTDYVLNTFD
jgi:hypothetical protein